MQDSFDLQIQIPAEKKSFTINIKASDTVDNLKAKIEDLKNLNSDDYKLIFRAKELVDGWAPMHVFGIKPEEFVAMVDCIKFHLKYCCWFWGCFAAFKSK